MFLRDALLQSPQLAATQKANGSDVDRKTSAHSQRRKRSDFLRAYSSISASQVLRVILLVVIGWGFTKLSHVAQARPGTAISGLAGHGFIGDLRNAR